MTTPRPSQVSDQGAQVNLVRRCPLANGSQTAWHAHRAKTQALDWTAVSYIHVWTWSSDQTHYGIMISGEDDEELDEAVEQYVTDTTWSWVMWFVNHLHVWKKERKKHELRVNESTCWWKSEWLRIHTHVGYSMKEKIAHIMCLDTLLHVSTCVCVFCFTTEQG